ncbi:MAG: hypothetical protein IPL04_17745 [Chitinophagaceae bacterium]|nr:hypothetical protein [Chitinophagaceae bacterium]
MQKLLLRYHGFVKDYKAPDASRGQGMCYYWYYYYMTDIAIGTSIGTIVKIKSWFRPALSHTK